MNLPAPALILDSLLPRRMRYTPARGLRREHSFFANFPKPNRFFPIRTLFLMETNISITILFGKSMKIFLPNSQGEHCLKRFLKKQQRERKKGKCSRFWIGVPEMRGP